MTSKSQQRLRECSASNPNGCRFALIHKAPQWRFEFLVLLGRHHPIIIIAPSVGSELSKIVGGSSQSAHVFRVKHANDDKKDPNPSMFQICGRA